MLEKKYHEVAVPNIDQYDGHFTNPNIHTKHECY